MTFSLKRSAILFGVLLPLIAVLQAGCLTRWTIKQAMGPVPDRFDEFVKVEKAWSSAESISFQLEARLEQRLSNARKNPGQEGEDVLWVVPRAMITAGLHNKIPREQFFFDQPAPRLENPFTNQPAFLGADSIQAIPCFDLRDVSVPRREGKMKRLAKKHPEAVFLFSRTREYTEEYNSYLLYTLHNTAERRVDVFRIEPEPVPGEPNPLYFLATPFALVGDIAMLPLGLVMLFLTESTSSINVNVDA